MIKNDRRPFGGLLLGSLLKSCFAVARRGLAQEGRWCCWKHQTESVLGFWVTTYGSLN